MKRTLIWRIAVSLSISWLFFVVPNIKGNSSAASTTAGGIQLIREKRISMQKEKLFVSLDRVTVDYEFLNQTDKNITTEVAFPVPLYRFLGDDSGGPRSFDDFRIWVDGSEIKYKTEIKGIMNGRDCSTILRRLNIDIATFGHMDSIDFVPYDFEKLPETPQNELRKAGLYNPGPTWQVKKTYYWQETFPARKVLRVRHEYRPVRGHDIVVPDVLNPVKRSVSEAQTRADLNRLAKGTRDFDLKQSELDHYTNLDMGCMATSLQTTLSEAAGENEYFGLQWVDYILTTANNWKTPIKEFELLVERPKVNASASSDPWTVSFCWDGPITRVDADHFQAKAIDFIPKHELKVLFLELCR